MQPDHQAALVLIGPFIRKGQRRNAAVRGVIALILGGEVAAPQIVSLDPLTLGCGVGPRLGVGPLIDHRGKAALGVGEFLCKIHGGSSFVGPFPLAANLVLLGVTRKTPAWL